MKHWRVGVIGSLIFIVLVVAVVFSSVNGWITFDVPNIQGTDQSKSQISNPVALNDEEFRIPEKVNDRGLNIIFLADQYSSWEEFENDSNALMGELKTIEPWQSYQSFNIYKINPKENGLCYIKVKDERKPVLRCLPEINRYLNNLPLENFRLIVLSRQEFQSWANVTRSENSGIFFSVPHSVTETGDQKVNALLLAHLLGHTFGLKDEEIFVLAQAGGAPHTPDGPNCAPDVTTAEKWWGDLTKKYTEVGYFKGCAGDENYIKPTQSSIMNLNTGAPIVYNYGPVSERYLKKILDYCFSSKRYKKSDDPSFFNSYPELSTCID
jgi:hypothetical protein